MDKNDEGRWLVAPFHWLYRSLPYRYWAREIENLFMELGLVNKANRYPDFYRQEIFSRQPMHYKVTFELCRGVSLADIQEKENYFRDGLRGEVTITGSNGYVVFEVYRGRMPKVIPFSFDVEKYLASHVIPLPIGRTDNGRDLLVWDLVEIPHVKIGGTTLSGKSNLLYGWVMSLLQNPKVELYIIDMALTDFLFAKDHVVFGSTLDDAYNIFSHLETIMHQRRKELAKHRLRNWGQYRERYPEKYLPYKVLVVDEFAFCSPAIGINKDDRDFRKMLHNKIWQLSMLARKCGIHLILACQLPTDKIFPTDLRGNFAGSISFKTVGNTESIIILNNGSAYRLPEIKGRCIAQLGSKQVEAQTMYYDTDILDKDILDIPIRNKEVVDIDIKSKTKRLPPR